MPSPRTRIGTSAEIVAAAELGKRGYEIVASNYRCQFGEIDLIANEGDSLVFVEVRTKRTDNYGTPADSITVSKIRKIVTTAQHYLDKNALTDIACRFDIVEIVLIDGKLVVKDVIRDAFTA